MFPSAFRAYDKIVPGVFGSLLPWLVLFLTTAGYGLSAYVLPLLTFSLIKPITKRMSLFHLLLAVLLAGIGALQELFPSRASQSVGMCGITGIHLYAFIVLLFASRAQKSRSIQSFLNYTIAFLLTIISCAIIEVSLWRTPFLPQILREYPVIQIAYFYGMAILLLIFATWYQFKRMVQIQVELSDSFIQKYAISPREIEIVHMIIQGYSNRVIGEKLFISAMTVKNHVYNIYRKTGVSNKVQLLNLINHQR